MKKRVIPELINNFNAYKSGNKLVGVTSNVALPDLESLTETIAGAGILGEYEAPAVGRYGSMEQEIPFRVLYEDIFDYMDPTAALDLTLRGDIQVADASTGAVGHVGMRVVFRGRQKKLKPGKMEQGKIMDASVTLEITYFMVEIDGKQMVELDKLNSVFKVKGKNILEKIAKNC